MKRILLAFFLLISGYHNAMADAPVIFFTDMADGPNRGWEGSSTKGAAVTVYGINLGLQRGTSHVTLANANANTSIDLTADTDYAEWGATANPITPTFNGTDQLQRITFFLNDSMGTLGAYPNSTIKVTTSEGASGTVSFHCRSTGNIYFITKSGSDSYDGTYASYQSGTIGPKASFASAKQLLSAGDVLYWGEGTWREADMVSWMNSKYSIMAFHWPTWQNANGTQGHSITVKAYPAAHVLLDGSTDSLSVLKRHGDNNTLNYWTFSNFTTHGIYGHSTHHNGKDDHSRWIGFDMTSMDGEKTIFSINSGAANTNMHFLGNYIHDAGCTTRNCTPPAGNAYGFSVSGAGNYNIDREAGDIGHENIYIMYNEVSYQSDGHAYYVYGHQYDDRVDEITIAHNYFHDNSMSGSRIGGGDSNFGDGNYGFVEDLYFYNNLLSANGWEGASFGDAPSNTDGGGGNYYIYNNSFINDSSGCFSLSCGRTVECNFHLYNNLCVNAKAYLHDDECSDSNVNCTGSHNLTYGTTDPLPYFTDMQTNDPKLIGFIPQFGSPAIDNGLSSVNSVVTVDARGIRRPQNGVYDIGAYEYVVGSDTSPSPPQNLMVE